MKEESNLFRSAKSTARRKIKFLCAQTFFQFIVFRPQARVQMNCQRDEWRVFFINAGTSKSRFKPNAKRNRRFIAQIECARTKNSTRRAIVFGQIRRGECRSLCLNNSLKMKRGQQKSNRFHQKNFADVRTRLTMRREKNVRVIQRPADSFRSWLKRLWFCVHQRT